MPIGLSGGWNQIQFNLADFTRRAYGSNYVETMRMQIHANCRIRRIYFASRLYSDEELPAEYKLFLPIHRKKCVREKVDVTKISKHEKPEIEEPPVLYKTPSEQIIKEEIKKDVEAEIPPEVPLPPEEVHIPETEVPIEDEMEEDEYEIEHEYGIDDRHLFEEEDTAIAAIGTAVEAITEEHEEEDDFILNEMAMEDEG